MYKLIKVCNSILYFIFKHILGIMMYSNTGIYYFVKCFCSRVDTIVILQSPRMGEYLVTILAACGFYAV